MSQGCHQARASVEQAGNARDNLRSITEAVANITDMNHLMASAAEEQSGVAESINQNIVSLGQLAGEASQSVHQISSSSEELARLANDLQGHAAYFKV
jgi:methyl-accepting chemotaxis protein